jgi:transglutaminase-like putative cysteine protease
MQHVLVKILADSGRDTFGSAYLPDDPSVKILKAYTLKPDGKKVEPTDIRNGKIVFAAVEPGVIIEYQYTYDTYYGGWLKGYYYSHLPFQILDTPMLNCEWVVALPRDQKLNTYTNGKIAHHTRIRADEQVHIWRAENSWEFMAKWAANLVKDQMELDEALKAKLAVLTANQPTLQDKIRSIYNFVAKDIRYERRGDTRIFGVKPQKAANIYADGYGVCKDKALLLIALLRAIDVPAYFALVETNNLGHLVKDLPFSWFNHAIVCLAWDKEKPLFLDPTFNYTTCGDMWDYTQDNDAFVCKESGYEFIRTPVLPMPEQNSQDDIIILPDGQIQVTGSSQIKGYIAALLRHEYSIPGKRKELLEKQINQELSGAKVEKCEVKDWENINLPLGIDYQFNAPAFAHLSKNEMRFKVLGVYTPGEVYTEKSERLYDLILEFSVNNTDQQTYQLPANYQVNTLPGSLVIDTKWFKYERTWIKQKNALQCNRALEFKVKRVKKDEYAKFRETCTRVDAAEKEQVVLSLKP